MRYPYLSLTNVGNTETGVPTKQDLRNLPRMKGDICTTCGGLEHATLTQKDCRWFQSNRDNLDRCTYDRFGIMCVKVVGTGGIGKN